MIVFKINSNNIENFTTLIPSTFSIFFRFPEFINSLSREYEKSLKDDFHLQKVRRNYKFYNFCTLGTIFLKF